MLQLLEPIRSNYILIIGVVSLIFALSILCEWAYAQRLPRDNKRMLVSTVLSLLLLGSAFVTAFNWKIGISLWVLIFLIKSFILLFTYNFGIGSFIRPLLFFRKVENLQDSDIILEDLF